MSFADELRQAEARMKAQKEQEGKQRPKRKRATRTTASSEWLREDDIIALYLSLTNASKFFKENYSKKRKVSERAMVKRMDIFTLIHKGKNPTDACDQMKGVYQEYSDLDLKDYQKIVISILRGEFDPVNPTKVLRKPGL